MREDTYAPARVVNVVLGIWLFISAFAWPHSYEQLQNTWIVGVLCAAAAVVAMRYPEARYVNAVLGAWLFISVWALPTATRATAWNNAIVGIAMFIVALMPSYARGRPGGTLPGA